MSATASGLTAFVDALRQQVPSIRVYVGPDHVTELLNLPRAKEAAALLALRNAGA